MITSPIYSLLSAVALNVIGQLLIKVGLNSLGKINFSEGFISAYLRIFFSPFVIGGIFVYFISAIFWLYGLSKVDLSFAYPFLALSYVLIVFVGWFLLGENIPMLRLIGVLVVCLGVFLISRS